MVMVYSTVECENLTSGTHEVMGCGIGFEDGGRISGTGSSAKVSW